MQTLSCVISSILPWRHFSASMSGRGRIWRYVPSASSGGSHGARIYNSRLKYCMWAGVASMQAVSLGWLMCIFCVQVGFWERGYTENWNMSKLIGTIGTSNFDCICMDHSSKEWLKIAERRRIVSICSLGYDASDYDASSQCWCCCKGVYWPYGTTPPTDGSCERPSDTRWAPLSDTTDGFLADCAKVRLGLWVLGSSRDYLQSNVSTGGMSRSATAWGGCHLASETVSAAL